MPRPARYALRVREGMPGFVERTSLMRATNSRASCARSCGHFRPALAAANGDPDQDQKQIKSRAGRDESRPYDALAAARRSALLWLSGPRCIAAAADEKARRVSARDRAHSVACTGTCSQRNPAADANPSRRTREGRNVLGRVSLLTFSARAEKVSRSSAGRVEALVLQKTPAAKKRVSALRG